jgi:arabinose-5-phosphate isomerase
MGKYTKRLNEVIEFERKNIDKLISIFGSGMEIHITKIIDIIYSSYTENNKIVFLGVGKTGLLANKTAASFNSINISTVYLNCNELLHGDMGCINGNDTIIVMSNSGNTEDILKVLQKIKQNNTNQIILSICGNNKGRIKYLSDYIVYTGDVEESDRLNIVPTSSITNMLVIMNAIIVVLIDKIIEQFGEDYFKDKFLYNHSGGSLGRDLKTKVKVIMRKGSNLPYCYEHDSIEKVKNIMNSFKSGCVVVIDDIFKVIGIITDADIRRRYNEVPNTLVKDILTKDPITIKDNSNIIDAKNICKINNIDDIIVVDNNNKLVGIVDIQDIL